jgi:hypothetical protein
MLNMSSEFRDLWRQSSQTFRKPACGWRRYGKRCLRRRSQTGMGSRMAVEDAIRVVDDIAGSPAFEDTFASTRFPFSGRDLAVPVTVAFGDRDWILTKGSRRRNGLPAHARWLEVHGWGHVPMWRDPTGVSQLILESTRYYVIAGDGTRKPTEAFLGAGDRRGRPDRHLEILQRVLEVNAGERWVRVQPARASSRLNLTRTRLRCVKLILSEKRGASCSVLQLSCSSLRSA